jgi:rSAM/selenodomain-associated transferase 1
MSSKISNDALLIFIRNPELGKVKSRLAATIGASKALAIYQEMLLHTQNITKNLSIFKIIAYSDFIPLNDSWKKLKYKQILQKGSDLGIRMKNAFEQQFSQGNNKVIIIGSDCMDLNQNLIEIAFFELENKDVVIGPANDGGYYLLGIKKLHSEIFENKLWGSASVLKDTIETFKNLELSYHLLPALNDIDNESDWKLYLDNKAKAIN